MRFLYWLYALAACALCVFLFVHVRRAETSDPRALLEHARRAMSGPELDYLQAGHDLEAALAAAERASDRPLIEEVLLQRARLARRTGALSRAKADLEHVLAHHRPNSPVIEAMLAGVMLDGGETELALSRADAVLARDRGQAEAWGVRAQALLTLANRHIGDCVRLAGVSVAQSGLASTEALMRRIAARPLTDPGRLRLTQELHERFPASDKELARDVQERLDDASSLLSATPEALAQSFRGGVRPQALTDYIRTLHEGGESDAAADLGLAALSLPSYPTFAPLLRVMLDVLLQSGRSGAIGDLVDPKAVRRTGLGSDFYLAWARALAKLEDWPLLQLAGAQLRASDVPETRLYGEWCIALSLARRQRWQEASPMLRRRLQAADPEPFENAHALGWFALAESARAAGEALDEAASLERAIAAARPGLAGVGEAHLRLAELELERPTPNRSRALESLTHALRLLPARNAELEPRWRELGALIARGRKLDFARECAELARENLLAPAERRPSFEFVALAELQSSEGRLASALALALRALEQHPRLLPALRAASDAALGLGAWEPAVALLRERVEIEGPRPELIAALLEAPAEVLGPGRGLELVRLDPAGLGRRWAAEDLRERGRTSESIANLERIAPHARTDADRILLAELYFERRDYKSAQGQLAELQADAKVLASTAPLMLSIAARQGAKEHAARVLRLLDAKVELDLERLIEAIDELIAHDLVEVAALACERLDQRPKWRSPRLHLRLAQTALLGGDGAGAREALERALAYDESGSAELGRLIVAVEERRWGDCQALHAELLATEYRPTGLQFVALSALGERLDDARIVLAAEIEQRRRDEGAPPASPPTPLEALLEAALTALAHPHKPPADALPHEQGFGVLPANAVQRDPRPLLARLAALDDPNWAAWAVADLARQAPPTRGALWPTYLASRGAVWLGADELAEKLARALTAAWPKFAPAWDVAAEALAARALPEDDPRVLALLDARRAALSAAVLRPVDAALLDARLARLRGDLNDAAAHVERAFKADPKRTDVALERAHIARARRRWALAVESLRIALDAPGPAPSAELLREFTDALAAAKLELGAAFDSAHRRHCDYLLEKFALDPWVRLECAKLAYALDGAADPWVAEHAVGELERLRAQLPGGLESLQPGVTLRWAEYYARLDAARALELVESELAWAPWSVELWRARGQYAAELGRTQAALEALEVALQIAPEPAAARALVDLAARRGADASALEELIARVCDLTGLARTDPALQLARARTLACQQRAKLTPGITLLAGLWNQAQSAKQRDEPWRAIGLLYGMALCRRATGGDAKLALEVLGAIAPSISDPLDASVVATLRSVATALRARG